MESGIQSAYVAVLYKNRRGFRFDWKKRVSKDLNLTHSTIRMVDGLSGH